MPSIEYDNQGRPHRVDQGRERSRTFKSNRLKVLKANPWCHLCGDEIDLELKAPEPMSGSVDHLVPWSQGGTDDIENLVSAHLVCNQKRGTKDIDEVRYMPTSREW